MSNCSIGNIVNAFLVDACLVASILSRKFLEHAGTLTHSELLCRRKYIKTFRKFDV